jgi:hypothetical protein
VIKVDHQAVHVQFVRWESGAGMFRFSDTHSFAKRHPMALPATAEGRAG